jgi:hypothetical protein
MTIDPLWKNRYDGFYKRGCAPLYLAVFWRDRVGLFWIMVSPMGYAGPTAQTEVPPFYRGSDSQRTGERPVSSPFSLSDSLQNQRRSRVGPWSEAFEVDGDLVQYEVVV